MYNLYKILFEGEYLDEPLFYFKDEWYPTNVDWHDMIISLNNHANLDNIFKQVSTINIDKMVRHYLVAKVIGWPNLNKFFEETLRDKFKKAGLFYDEIEIIENEFIDLPEIYNDLILDFEQYDTLGGVALRHQDMGDFASDSPLFKAISSIADDIESIQFNKISLDYGNYHPNQRVIKLKFKSGSVAYFRVCKWSSNSYRLKSADYDDNNMNKGRFVTKFSIEAAPYIDGIKTDPENTPFYL